MTNYWPAPLGYRIGPFDGNGYAPFTIVFEAKTPVATTEYIIILSRHLPLGLVPVGGCIIIDKIMVNTNADAGLLGRWSFLMGGNSTTWETLKPSSLLFGSDSFEWSDLRWIVEANAQNEIGQFRYLTFGNETGPTTMVVMHGRIARGVPA